MQTKARSLFETLKERAGDDCRQKFVGSSGWFKRFKKKFQLHKVRVTREVASADKKAALEFVDNIEKIITNEGYLSEHFFMSMKRDYSGNECQHALTSSKKPKASMD